MSKQRDVKLIIREIREMDEWKHLSYNDVLDIVFYSQFGFSHKMISSGDRKDPESYKSFRHRYLGSFIAHPRRVEKCIDYNKNKDSDNTDSE